MHLINVDVYLALKDACKLDKFNFVKPPFPASA